MGCQSKADWCSPVFLQSFFDHSLVSIYTPGWRDVPLYFFSLFLTIHWYPFILPGGESMGTVKCFAQEPNTLTRPNLTVRLLQSDLNVIFFSFFFSWNLTFFHFIFFSGDARCKAFLQPYVDAATHISKYLQNLPLIEPVLSGHPVFSGQLSKSWIWFLIILSPNGLFLLSSTCIERSSKAWPLKWN